MILSPEWQQFGQWSFELGAPLTNNQLEQFSIYLTLLLAWNERMNLTAVREPAEIRLRHFLDSLSCVRVMGNINGRSLVDVGSGAGFPGFPLKILFPELKLTLVESVLKKGRFLRTVAAELGLSEVEVLVDRAELLGQKPAHREQYDWAVARAVAELRVLVEFLLPFCRVGGKVLAQKGAGIDEELARAVTAIERLGGGEPQLTEVKLPQRGEPHYLVVIDKVGKTPANYPRRVGIPAKRPL